MLSTESIIRELEFDARQTQEAMHEAAKAQDLATHEKLCAQYRRYVLTIKAALAKEAT